MLFEDEKDGFYQGHTENFILVKVKSDNDISNQILGVQIENRENLELIGKVTKM